MMDKGNIVKIIYKRMPLNDTRTEDTSGSGMREFGIKFGFSRKERLIIRCIFNQLVTSCG